jgi:hypothetical protein
MSFNRSFTPKISGTMDAMLAVKGDVWVCANGQAMSLVQTTRFPESARESGR